MYPVWRELANNDFFWHMYTRLLKVMASVTKFGESGLVGYGVAIELEGSWFKHHWALGRV